MTTCVKTIDADADRKVLPFALWRIHFFFVVSLFLSVSLSACVSGC